jgi:hypothetical protein
MECVALRVGLGEEEEEEEVEEEEEGVVEPAEDEKPAEVSAVACCTRLVQC